MTEFSNYHCFYGSHFPHCSGGSDGKFARPLEPEMTK